MLGGYPTTSGGKVQELSGKVAIITGGASGIGFAMARRFAAEGMKIMLADVEEAALDAALGTLRSAGADAAGLLTDVTQASQVKALADGTLSRFGAIHVACNNAGVFVGGLLWEASEADYRWALDVNLWGVIHGIRYFVPPMIAQDCECHIVNVASMAALTAMPYAGIYHASKHAVLGMSECLFHELSLHAPQVKVSVVCPEMVRTGIAESQRNRPAALSCPGDIPETESRRLVEDSIRESAAEGIDPALIADRTLAAIREGRFYVLGAGGWWASARQRLDDIRTGRNPVLTPPV